MFIALFGFAYLWLALRPTVDHPVLFLGALGKLSAFLLAAGLWLAGAAPLSVALASSGDLAFALLWLGWLRRPAAVR